MIDPTIGELNTSSPDHKSNILFHRAPGVVPMDRIIVNLRSVKYKVKWFKYVIGKIQVIEKWREQITDWIHGFMTSLIMALITPDSR